MRAIARDPIHWHTLTFERWVYRVKELPVEIVEAIKASRMDPAHDHLNALLDDE
jgi:hypothetical protein